MMPLMTNDSRRRLTLEELRERANELSQPLVGSDTSVSNVVGYLALRVDKEWFCLPVSSVREVLYKPRMSRVPFLPIFVSGLFNLRGEVMGLINLATLFEIGGERAHSKGWNFAVLLNDSALGETAAGMLSDEVCEVMPPPGTSLDRIPSSVTGEKAAFFQETFRFEGQTFTILDIDNILLHPDLNPKAA